MIINDSDLKKLHLVELIILDEFIRICNKFNLNYFLIGGTLLGAVRHNGFIPWDDDIDIGMPRKDFQKFLEICQSELYKDFYYLYLDNFEPYYYHFIKICKKNTLFIEND